jgi:hypothetical protein
VQLIPDKLDRSWIAPTCFNKAKGYTLRYLCTPITICAAAIQLFPAPVLPRNWPLTAVDFKCMRAELFCNSTIEPHSRSSAERTVPCGSVHSNCFYGGTPRKEFWLVDFLNRPFQHPIGAEPSDSGLPGISCVWAGRDATDND